MHHVSLWIWLFGLHHRHHQGIKVHLHEIAGRQKRTPCCDHTVTGIVSMLPSALEGNQTRMLEQQCNIYIPKICEIRRLRLLKIGIFRQKWAWHPNDGGVGGRWLEGVCGGGGDWTSGGRGRGELNRDPEPMTIFLKKKGSWAGK